MGGHAGQGVVDGLGRSTEGFRETVDLPYGVVWEKWHGSEKVGESVSLVMGVQRECSLFTQIYKS